jgi:hypothetical protein
MSASKSYQIEGVVVTGTMPSVATPASLAITQDKKAHPTKVILEFDKVSFGNLDLTPFNIRVDRILFGDIQTGQGHDSDLWHWIERHAKCLQNLMRMDFSQRRGDAPVISFMHQRLNDLGLHFEMSNHGRAAYAFVHYSRIYNGQPTRDLSTHLASLL